MHGFSTNSRGRRAFRICLQRCITDSSSPKGPQTEIVLSTCQHLSETLKECESDKFGSTNSPENEILINMMPAYLDEIHDQYEKFTQWVMGQQGPIYRKVLGAHIRCAIFRENGETSILSVQHQNPDYEADMEEYFAAWPKILADISSGEDEFILFDTWVVMLFHACCWGACHFFVPGERVPSEYYGSQLPVYIG